MSIHKAKVLVIGPCQSGKSVISNYLADATETSGGEYHPTQGCRILEFEVNNIEVGGRDVTTEVELWDVSGDHKFEQCWPAIARDANGIVFVFNPEHPNHDKELDSWYEYFVRKSTVKNSQCIVFAHSRAVGPEKIVGPRPPASMGQISCFSSNVDDEGELLREEFNNYLSRLMTAVSDKREQEELSIMNNR